MINILKQNEKIFNDECDIILNDIKANLNLDTFEIDVRSRWVNSLNILNQAMNCIQTWINNVFVVHYYLLNQEPLRHQRQ